MVEFSNDLKSAVCGDELDFMHRSLLDHPVDLIIVPGAPNKLCWVNLDRRALGGLPHGEGVDEAQGVEAVILPRVGRGEKLGLPLPTLPVSQGKLTTGKVSMV